MLTNLRCKNELPREVLDYIHQDEGGKLMKVSYKDVGTNQWCEVEHEPKETCPICGQFVYDNRTTKKNKQPDFKCSDKDNCKWAGWIVTAKPKTKPNLNQTNITFEQEAKYILNAILENVKIIAENTKRNG